MRVDPHAAMWWEVVADGRKPPRETGLTPLGRPDLRGCALLASWRFWCPRGLGGRTFVSYIHVSGCFPKRFNFE